jgi:hypothetical protein
MYTPSTRSYRITTQEREDIRTAAHYGQQLTLRAANLDDYAAIKFEVNLIIQVCGAAKAALILQAVNDRTEDQQRVTAQLVEALIAEEKGMLQ